MWSQGFICHSLQDIRSKAYANFSNKDRQLICCTTPLIDRFTSMYMYVHVFNIGSLCYQSIASSNGPVRRRHIFLVKHIRFPTKRHPRGRTFRWIHKPKDLLNPLGTNPCLPLWDQHRPWSRGSMSRKPFCNYFETQLVLQPAWVWLLESHLKTAFQILKK